MTGNLLRSPILWGGVALLAAAITYLLFGYFQVQAAFIDREVNEEFVASSETVEDNSPTETTQEMPETTEEETTTEKEAVGATTTETTEKATEPHRSPHRNPHRSRPGRSRFRRERSTTWSMRVRAMPSSTGKRTVPTCCG